MTKTPHPKVPDLSRWPEWRAYLDREAELAQRIATTRAAMRAKDDRNAASRAAWQAERAAAHAEGHPAPPGPPLADSTPERDLLDELTRQRGDLAGQRARVLAGIAADVETAWRDTLPGLVEAVRDTSVARLPTRLAEVRAWHRTLREVRRAVETADPNARITNGPSTRMPAKIDLPDLLALADGTDLCAPRHPDPRPDREPTPFKVTPSDDGTLRLGLEPRRPFGAAPDLRPAATTHPGEI